MTADLKLHVVDTEALGLILPGRWEPYLEKKGWVRNHVRTMTVPFMHCYEFHDKQLAMFLPAAHPEIQPGSSQYGHMMETMLRNVSTAAEVTQLEVLVDLIGLHEVLSRLSRVLQLLDAPQPGVKPGSKNMRKMAPPAPEPPARGWDGSSRGDIRKWKSSKPAGAKRTVRSQQLNGDAYLVTLIQTNPEGHVRADHPVRRKALQLALGKWNKEYSK